MRSTVLVCVTTSLFAVAGCLEARAGEEPLSSPMHVVVVTELTAPPLGGDGPTTFELALQDERGETRISGAALAGVAFQDGALVLRADGILEMVRGATGEQVDQGVIVAPVVSRDGMHAAWVSGRPLDEAALIVVDTSGMRLEAATGLVSMGAIAFEDVQSHRRIAFVGAVNGGIAGVWVTSVDGSMRTRCLTNCQLRTGADLSEMTPLPESPLAFVQDEIRWRAEGQTESVRLTSGATSSLGAE